MCFEQPVPLFAVFAVFAVFGVFFVFVVFVVFVVLCVACALSAVLVLYHLYCYNQSSLCFASVWIHAFCQAHPLVLILTRFGVLATLRVYTVVMTGSTGSGSLVFRCFRTHTAVGMACTRIAMEQCCHPCMRDGATALVSAASSGVCVRLRGVSLVVVSFLTASLSFLLVRFLGELVMSCGIRSQGVCGMMLYVLMPHVLVDCRWARYRGSRLTHVDRRFSDAVRA